MWMEGEFSTTLPRERPNCFLNRGLRAFRDGWVFGCRFLGVLMRGGLLVWDWFLTFFEICLKGGVGACDRNMARTRAEWSERQ